MISTPGAARATSGPGWRKRRCGLDLRGAMANARAAAGSKTLTPNLPEKPPPRPRSTRIAPHHTRFVYWQEKCPAQAHVDHPAPVGGKLDPRVTELTERCQRIEHFDRRCAPPTSAGNPLWLLVTARRTPAPGCPWRSLRDVVEVNEVDPPTWAQVGRVKITRNEKRWSPRWNLDNARPRGVMSRPYWWAGWIGWGSRPGIKIILFSVDHSGCFPGQQWH